MQLVKSSKNYFCDLWRPSNLNKFHEKFTLFEKLQNSVLYYVLWEGITRKKSLSAHVLDLKITLRRRMMMTFVSADRYDLKQAFKHKHYGSKAFQKYSGALQLNTSWSPTSSFWGQESHLDEIGLKTHKNERLRAFLEIKNVFDAFETHHECFWID